MKQLLFLTGVLLMSLPQTWATDSPKPKSSPSRVLSKPRSVSPVVTFNPASGTYTVGQSITLTITNLSSDIATSYGVDLTDASGNQSFQFGSGNNGVTRLANTPTSGTIAITIPAGSESGVDDRQFIIFPSGGSSADEGISDLFTIVAASSPCTNPTVSITPSSQTITSGGSVTLTASGATTYTWSNGSTANPLIVSNVTSATAFSVTGVTGACSATASAAVSVTTAGNPCAFVPRSITVTGMGGDFDGVYTPSGTRDGAPLWTKGNNYISYGDEFTPWIIGGGAFVEAGTKDGSVRNLPCSGWKKIGNGVYGVPTLSGGCGSLVGGPSVSITPSSQTITSGGSATLTASGATTYTWSNGSTTNPLIVSNVTSATAFSVTGVTGQCSATASAAVSVVDACALFSPQNLTITGIVGSVELDPSPNGEYTPGPLVNGVPTWVKTGYTLVWAGDLWAIIDFTGFGAYGFNRTGSATFLPCTGWEPGNASGYTAPTLLGWCGVITQGVAVSISPSSQTITSGSSVTLTASGATTYTWSNGSTDNPLVLTNVTSATTLSVTGTNGTCSATASAAVSVTAATRPSPPVIAAVGAATVCAGTSLTVGATSGCASGTLAYTYASDDFPDPTTVSPANGLLVLTLPGAYTLTATCSTSAGTSLASNPIQVQVNTNPTVTITGGNVAICAGQSLTLGTQVNFQAPPSQDQSLSPYRYAWSPAPVSQNDQTGTAVMKPASTQTYTVKVTDANNCTVVSAPVAVTVNALPTAVISPNATTICAGQSTTLTASGGTGYAWSNMVNTAANVVAPLNMTAYSVTVTSNGCSSSTSVTVTVNPAVTASISGNQVLSCGQSLTLSASGSGTGYTWSANAGSSTSAQVVVRPAQTGTVYSVTATGSGCSGVASVTATLAPVMAAQAISSTAMSTLSTTNCPVMIQSTGTGNAFVFTNPVTGFSYSTVYRNGSTYTLPAFPVKQPGTYTMTAYFTDACGQTSTDTRTFVVTGTGCN